MDKQINLKVVADGEYSDIETLEQKINKLKHEKLNFRIEADNSKIVSIDEQIARLKSEINSLSSTELDVRANANQINELISKINSLEAEKIDLQLDVETAELEKVEDEIHKLEQEEIEVQLKNQSAMEGIQQIADGFDRLKQGASEIGQQMGTLLESAGKQETNYTFLERAVGDPKIAKQKMDDIQEIVTDLPGDDTAVQGLLSQAIAKDASLTTDALKGIGVAYADYASAMRYYGKSSVEAQQDMTNYILAGNTAELERSPILSSHIDKLKEATTVQERAKLLQEALNEEHWGGMSQQDTYNNKLDTFIGMLDRGKYNLGGMFQEGAKAGMDFLMKLDDSTNGLVGMSIALAGFASPLTDALFGLGQMATGIRAIKDLGFIKYLKDLEIVTKLSAIADYLLAGAQAVLNAVMSMNPIILVVLAIMALIAVLVWAYYNVDWFREMVDNAFASLVQIAQAVYSFIQPAIQWLGSLFNQFTSQIGLNTNDWIQAILGFILFIPQLPMQLGVALINALAKTLGFGNNFVQTITNSAVRSVTNFMQWIRSLPSQLQNELNRMLSAVGEWASTLPQKFWDAGVNAVKNFLNALGIHSPGFMYWNLYGELNRLENLPEDKENDITGNIGRLGSNITNAFNPDLNYGFANNDLTDAVHNGVGQVNNFYFTDTVVDNEDRMQRIVEYVAKSINWDNTTAGRNV